MSFTLNKSKSSNDFNYPLAQIKVKNKWKDIYFNYDSNIGVNEIRGEIKRKCYVEKNQRHTYFISGQSGSGKSTQASNIIKDLHKIDNNDWFLITNNSTIDPKLDISYVHRWTVDEIYDNQLSEHDLVDDLGSLNIILDDFDNHPDKLVNKYIFDFVKIVLENTRKLGTQIIYITHDARKGMITKDINKETTCYVLPMNDLLEIKKILKDKIGLNKTKEVNALLDSIPKGRYTFLNIMRIPVPIVLVEGKNGLIKII